MHMSLRPSIGTPSWQPSLCFAPHQCAVAHPALNSRPAERLVLSDYRGKRVCKEADLKTQQIDFAKELRPSRVTTYQSKSLMGQLWDHISTHLHPPGLFLKDLTSLTSCTDVPWWIWSMNMTLCPFFPFSMATPFESLRERAPEPL